ncbi:MAG: TonB-dependent receptor [Desulfobacterales bacterium]|nr:TonB-dependent receptor [Desulfobacterales bacterium]
MRTKNKLSKLLGLRIGVLAGLFLSTVGAPSIASGSGFAVYTHGAKELGMQNSVIAHSEGPASNYHNPALITELKGTQIEAGTTLIFPSREFKSAQTGKTEKTESRVFYPSTLFVTHQLNERFTAGLGIISPFGLGTDWGKQWEGRYLATNSEMQTFNINPNIAWKVNDKLAVAGGLDLLLLDATLEKNINFSAYVLPDAEQKFDGDGDGIGYNLGLVYCPNEDWSFGASYRSGIKVDVEGNAEFKLPQGTPPLLKANFPNTGGTTEIELPAQLFFGLCYQGIDKLTLEVGGRWEGWSCYEELAFKFDQPVAGSKTSVFKKNWKDVVSCAVGAKYDLNDTFAIFGGYRFDDNPIPDDTFEPGITASDKHCISLGVGKTFGNLVAGVSYHYEKYESRKKDNSLGASLGGTANGEYNSDAHMVGVSVSYEF